MSHRLFIRTAFAVSLVALPLCAHAAERHTNALRSRSRSTARASHLASLMEPWDC